MAKKNFINRFRRRRRAAGFTLIELLVSVAMGWIVISGLLYMVVQMLQSDRKEYALTQTQLEMDLALDYITTELQEAVYVYEKECLLGRPDDTSTDVDESCKGLSFIPNTPSQQPILAFWKQESLPYVEDDPTAAQQLPTNTYCSGTTERQCNALLLNRHSPTLVVYSLRTDNPTGEIWQGPARLTRFELRAFDPDKLSTLTPAEGYPKDNNLPRNPAAVGFANWPCKEDGSDCNAAIKFNDRVLVDLVDTKTIEDKDENLCPPGTEYKLSKADKTPNETDSFYACIRPYSETSGQDVIVHLRGNAIKRAGLSGWDKKSRFLPHLQAQVQTRSLPEKKGLSF